MLQEKINRAYGSLMKLSNFNLPVKKAYAVYKLVQAVEGAYQFAFNEQQKYLAEFKGVPSEDGNIIFETPAECVAFKNKLEELNGVDVEISIDAVNLTEDDLGEQTLTPTDIFNLEGFVDFA